MEEETQAMPILIIEPNWAKAIRCVQESTKTFQQERGEKPSKVFASRELLMSFAAHPEVPVEDIRMIIEDIPTVYDSGLAGFACYARV